MPMRLALLAALLLAAPPAASGGSGGARLLVSATVVRTVRISVAEGAAGAPALSVRTVGGGGWSAHAVSPDGPALRPGKRAGVAAVPALAVEPYAADPTYLVVTVLADAPYPAAGDGPAR